MGLPELLIQHIDAGKQEIEILARLVIEVILGIEADHPGADAQVDVLGHQDHLAVLETMHHGLDRSEDTCIARTITGTEQQLAAGVVAIGEWSEFSKAQAVFDFLKGFLADQRIEIPAHLAHVARHLGKPLLAGIQFLQDHHGQHHPVFCKAKQGGGVVHQHVGV